jgi:predicted transcriptional regulator
MPDEPHSTPQVVGNNLSRLLGEQTPPMSQSELARQLGVDQSAVSQYVNGRVTMNITTLKRIADILDVKPCHLLIADEVAA